MTIALDHLTAAVRRWEDWLLDADKVHPLPPPLWEGRFPGEEAVPLLRRLIRDGLDLGDPRFLMPLLEALGDRAEDLVGHWVRPCLDPSGGSAMQRRHMLELVQCCRVVPGWAAVLGAHAATVGDKDLSSALKKGGWTPDHQAPGGRGALHALANPAIGPELACPAAEVLAKLGVSWDSEDDMGMKASERWRALWSPSQLSDGINTSVYADWVKVLPAPDPPVLPVWNDAARAVIGAVRGQLAPLTRWLSQPDLDPHAQPERNPLLHESGLVGHWVGPCIDASAWGTVLTHGTAPHLDRLLALGADPTRPIAVLDAGRHGLGLREEHPLIAPLARQNAAAGPLIIRLLAAGVRALHEDRSQAGPTRGDSFFHLVALWGEDGAPEARALLKAFLDHHPRTHWLAPDRQGTPALHRCLRLGRVHTARMLLNEGPATQAMAVDGMGENALHALVQGGWNAGTSALAQALVAQGANWGTINEIGESALDQVSRRPKAERSDWFALAQATGAQLGHARTLHPEDARRFSRATGHLTASISAEYRNKAELADRAIQDETVPVHSMAETGVPVRVPRSMVR